MCHSINALTRHLFFDDIVNTPSGLLFRRCSSPDCVLKLELGPLHVLTMVGYKLAQSGYPDEDLFGIIACLLCLLAHGADSTSFADISLSFLFDKEPESECEHDALRPSDLAKHISRAYSKSWQPCTQTGWHLFCYILELYERPWTLLR